MKAPYSLFDTHAHLALLDHDPLGQILNRARTAGVRGIVSVSTDEPSWESNRNLALETPNVWYTVGLHPHDAIRWPECAANMLATFRDGVPEKCVAIGELGLDYHYEFSPRDVQRDVLRSQLSVARQVDLPVVIHCRDAYDDLYATIRDEGLSSRGGIMHCFTGNTAQAKAALDLGLWISFSGIVTFKNAEALREAAAYVPLDRMLVETDCPFLAPIPFRGKPSEPGMLPYTVRRLAEVKKVTPEALASATFENALAAFRVSIGATTT
jgi:TatD DNase family protein